MSDDVAILKIVFRTLITKDSPHPNPLLKEREQLGLNFYFIMHKRQYILILILILLFPILFISCSSSKNVKAPSGKKFKYFKILADANDDPIFVKLQDDLHIDPKMERYSIIVDIRSIDPGQQYLFFGDETNPIRYLWSQVSPQVQQGLINWTGNSKENLE